MSGHNAYDREQAERLNKRASSSNSDFERLVMKIREGFMTCTSKPGGPYTVAIEFGSFKDAHELHRILCEIESS